MDREKQEGSTKRVMTRRSSRSVSSGWVREATQEEVLALPAIPEQQKNSGDDLLVPCKNADGGSKAEAEPGRRRRRPPWRRSVAAARFGGRA